MVVVVLTFEESLGDDNNTKELIVDFNNNIAFINDNQVNFKIPSRSVVFFLKGKCQQNMKSGGKGKQR